MDLLIGGRWESFVEEAIRSGRYASASEVVQEGLRLVQEREAKLQALRELIDAAEAQGGENSEEDVEQALDRVEARLREELR